ncbi:MAG: YfbM family protein [Planctomycetota bacterium]
MGMCAVLITLGDVNIARLLHDPPLIWQLVAPDDPEPYEEARAQQQKPTLLTRIFGRGRQASSVPDLQLSAGEGVSTDLDKAWHGIHYLLTATAWEGEPPRNFLVGSGRAVGDIEVGYGPARAFTAAETLQVRDALRALSDNDLRARFHPTDMIEKQIYPEIWTRDPEQDDTLGYLMEYVQPLRGFFDQTVRDGLGFVVSIR